MNYFDKLYAELHQSPDYAAEILTLAVTGIIRRHMQQHGFTQEALAEKLGVTQANIAKKLRGSQNLTLKSVAEIATALGVEWVGMDLVAHEEARQRERKAALAREIDWNVMPFTMKAKVLKDGQDTAETDLTNCA